MARIQFAKPRVSKRSTTNNRTEQINASPLAETLRNQFSGYQFSFDQFGFYVKRHDNYFKFNTLGKLIQMTPETHGKKSARITWSEFQGVVPFIRDSGRWLLGPKNYFGVRKRHAEWV